MNSEEIFNRLKKMGFEFERDIEEQIEELSNEVKQLGISNETAEQVIKPIIAFKTSDVALLNKRMNIKEEDLGIVKGTCLRIVICLRSSILENPNVSASVMTSTDQRQLELIGITKNKQLASVPLQDIINRTVRHITDSNPNFKIPDEDVDFLRKRVEIWKQEAEILCNV